MAELFREVTTQFPRLDYAVIAAGVFRNTGELHALSYVDFTVVVAINLVGVWLCMQAEITQMLAQGGGAIVNLTSGVVRHPIKQAAAYVATKHAIVGLTQVAALENSTRGLRVNCVAPGIIQTPILDLLAPAQVQHMVSGVPVRRLGTPAEVAQAILWLCSDHASYVNGITLDVGGGLQL